MIGSHVLTSCAWQMYGHSNRDVDAAVAAHLREEGIDVGEEEKDGTHVGCVVGTEAAASESDEDEVADHLTLRRGLIVHYARRLRYSSHSQV